jgi:prolyl-tRNA synthetase
VARRDTKEKMVMPIEGVSTKISDLLIEIQDNIYQKALTFRENMTTTVDDYASFKEVLDDKGGFILAHWDGTAETEERIKEETKATIRLIPFDESGEGVCIYSGQPSKQRVVFARAY